jgi:GNAT superfamily N-acetyltransferase
MKKKNKGRQEITMLRMGKKHIKPISLMLSRAFKDEMKDLFPDAEERRIKEPCVSEFYLRCSYSYSKGFMTSPQMEGFALWSYSEKRLAKRTFWRILSSGAIWLAIKIGSKALKKMGRFDEYIENKHSELAPFKHLYLDVLGVDPPHQGKGYASKLLKETFSKMDTEGLPYYLEADKEKNISMYQHFGFRILGEFDVPDSTERMTAMLRESKKQPVGDKITQTVKQNRSNYSQKNEISYKKWYPQRNSNPCCRLERPVS